MVSTIKAKSNNKQWDLFICHATEDKEEVVRPLVGALINAGYNVWYDEFMLTIGDSLRRSIDKGLVKSKYGLIILSHNFFEKKWPQTELDGLVAREHEGKKVILPIWHNVDERFIREFSPTLADKVAVSTDRGIAYIVDEIRKVVEPSRSGRSREDVKNSIRAVLETTINSLKDRDKDSIKKDVSKASFKDLKKKYYNVLDGIAIFNLSGTQSDENVFKFLELAIMERNRDEGAKLFRILLNWFFQTATPYCRIQILNIFTKLTKLPFLREIVDETKRVSSFVADFALSESYEVAGINAEILMNLKSLLSEVDHVRITDAASSNDQIKGSWKAQRYLEKLSKP